MERTHEYVINTLYNDMLTVRDHVLNIISTYLGIHSKMTQTYIQTCVLVIHKQVVSNRNDN